MTALIDLPHAAWVQQLGWTLVQFLWQGTLIAAIFAALRGLIRRRATAEVRYLLACGTLAVMTLAPVLTFLVRVGVPLAPAWPVPSPDVWQTVLPWLVAAWLTGVGFGAARFIGRWHATRRLRSLGVQGAPLDWCQRLADLGRRLGIGRPVRLVVSSLVEFPIVLGWWRPIILVPIGALTGLPASQVEALLAHELAHIRRLDYLVNILQGVVEAVLFYHPAVWWVSREIRTERELCCDDLAVALSGDVLIYAQALTELESHRPAHTHAVAATGGSLIDRIGRLLGQAPPASHALPAPGVAGTMTLLWLVGLGAVGTHAASGPAGFAPGVARAGIAAPATVATPTPMAAPPAVAAPSTVAAPGTTAGPTLSSLLFNPVGPAAGQQPKPTAASTPAKDTPRDSGGVMGTVTDATTGVPVAGAVIVLKDDQPGSTLPPHTQITTPTGRFAFVDLPASPRYLLTATKSGWLDGGYQRTDPRGPSAPIALADGQWLANVRVTLTRPGSISGTVEDERGEPLVGASVRVLAQVLLAGRPQWLVGLAARTDDRGTYRIAGLGPGRYVVEVPSVQATLPEGAPPPSRGGAGAGTSMADLDEAVAANRAERLVVDVSGSWHRVVGFYAVPPPPTPDGARQAYPIVFAPNAATPAEAVPIDLRLSESRSGIDVHVQPVRVARVSGVIQGPPEAIGHLPLRLMPIGLEELGQGSEAATTLTQPDGHFTFLDVPSGSYVLDASHMRVDYTYTSRNEARTAVPSPVPFPAQRASSGTISAAPAGVEYSALQDGVSAPYWGQLRVSVSAQDIDRLVLTLHAPVTVSGRIAWAEGVTPAGRVPPLVLEPADGRRSLGIPSSVRFPTGPADAFAFGSAVAGQYFLRPMFGAAVAAITWNGQDYTERPFDTTSGADITGVVLTLTTASSSVSGIVRDGTAALTTSAAVIAFPIQKELWSNYGLDPPYLKSVLATTDGHFRIDGLPAGDYDVVAVPASEERAWLDPAFLASRAGVATRMRVDKADAVVSNVNLRLVR